MSPFDYVNEILQGKKQLMIDEQTEAVYAPFLINRALSYHKDCIMYANEMNRRHHLDKKMQFDFLCQAIRSKKRTFAKWVKSEKNDDIDIVKKIYGCSDSKAKEALMLLNEEQLKEMREKLDVGGI